MDVKGIIWDAGNWPKCGKHGVSRDEIEHVLYQEPIVSPDLKHSDVEDRFVAVGTTKAGRALFVGFTYRFIGSDRYIRPVTSRFMHRKEMDRYAAYRAGHED